MGTSFLTMDLVFRNRNAFYSLGETVNKIFDVEIDNNLTVEVLKDEIKNVRQDLRQVNFDLYEVNFFQPIHNFYLAGNRLYDKNS